MTHVIETDHALPSLGWSLFSGARDNRPRRRSGTWRDLLPLLTAINQPPNHTDPGEAKKSVPAFSGAVFADGATRKADNVEGIQILAFDFDNTVEEPIPGEFFASGRPKTRKVPISKPASPEEVILALDLAGLAAVVYTTWSSTTALPKFRTVLPLASPVPPTLWEEATEWALEKLRFQRWRDSGAIDIPVLRDTARLNFLPCAPNPESVQVWEAVGDHLRIPVEELDGYAIKDRPRPEWMRPRPKTDPGTGQGWWMSFGADFKTLDLAGLVEAMGVEVGKEKPWKDGTKRRCHCPWSSEHTHALDDDSAVIVATPGDWPSFRCLHSSHAEVGLREICEAAGAEMVQAFSQPYAAAEDFVGKVDQSDTGNSNLLIELAEGNLRYVPERCLWLWWDGSRWIADEFGSAAMKAALRVAEHYQLEAEELKTKARSNLLDEDNRKRQEKVADRVAKWAIHCRNRRTLDAMLALAAKNARISLAAAELDADPWLFGVANGVVDLRTGQLRAAARDEFVTKRSPVEFDATAPAPRWRQFVDEITGRPLPVAFDELEDPIPETVGRFEKRPKLAAYLQRVMGYCMTGSTAEQKMFVALGGGSNGKNVMLDMVQELAGGYCKTIPPEALMATRHDGDSERPSPTAASLAGARMAISSESRDGQKLDVALVKRHTGGGYMTARLMRENTFRFCITHKLVLMTNHRPSLDHMDDALRGRLHLIPFDMKWNRPGHPERDVTAPDGDKDLMAKLRAESPGVLAWLVEGAVAYACEGLEPPEDVLRATRAYFATEDPVARWMEGYVRCPVENGTGAKALFCQFEAWKSHNAAFGQTGPGTENALGRTLHSLHGVEKKRFSSGVRYGLIKNSA